MQKIALTIALLSCATPGLAEVPSLYLMCTIGGGGDIQQKVVTRLFTVSDDHLGEGWGIEKVRSYGVEFKQTLSVNGYSQQSLIGQFAAFARKKNAVGSCSASTDRQMMLAYYRKLSERGYNKFYLDDWRPVGKFVLKAEEWPN